MINRGFLIKFGFSLMFFLFFNFSFVFADIPSGYEEFYVPGKEEDLWQIFQEIDNSPDLDENQGMHSAVSVTTTLDDTKLFYDHWEDGYDFDYQDPDNSADEVYLLNQGDFKSFESSNIPISPRGGDLYYDGGDKIYTSGGPVSMVRASWPESVSSVFAFAWEIYPTRALLNGYTIPFGVDLAQNPYNYSDFDRVILLVQAVKNNTSVQIDDPSDPGIEINQTLNQGESVKLFDISKSTKVTSSQAVQVQVLAGRGHGGLNSEIRGFSIVPDGLWDKTYFSALGGFNDANTNIYIFNPNSQSITINYKDKEKSGTFELPAQEITSYFDITGGYVPLDSAVKLESGDYFWGVGSVDTNHLDYDWGFSLIPTNIIQSEYFLGWAPGTSDSSPSENGSPVYVTPVEDETAVYVDFSPTDGNYDEFKVLNTMESFKVFDPDNDNTGMHVWASKDIVLLWGQDPDSSLPGNPYLDMGYPVLPLPRDWMDLVLTIDKLSDPGTILPQENMEFDFILNVETYDHPVFEVDVWDTLPEEFDYVEESTRIFLPNGKVLKGQDYEPRINDRELFWDLSLDLNPDEIIKIKFKAKANSNIREGYIQNNTKASGVRLGGAQIFSPVASTFTFVTDFYVNKSTLNSAVRPGQEAQFKIVIENHGNYPLTGLSVIDELPPGFSYQDVEIIVEGAVRTSHNDPSQGQTDSIQFGSWDLDPGGVITIIYTTLVDEDAQGGRFDTTLEVITNETGTVTDAGNSGGDSNTPPGSDNEDDEDITVLNSKYENEIIEENQQEKEDIFQWAYEIDLEQDQTEESANQESQNPKQNDSDSRNNDQDKDDDEDGQEQDNQQGQNNIQTGYEQENYYSNQQDQEQAPYLNPYYIDNIEGSEPEQAAGDKYASSRTNEGLPVNSSPIQSEQKQKPKDQSRNSDSKDFIKFVLAFLGGGGGLFIIFGFNTNPMGVMLGEHKMTLREKINLTKKLKGSYYKPRDVNINRWRGE
ncbi:MAG: DUF11 domain-containing protein [Candidatus Moranbacteria bacterium]|nr:DUF11 domain-containing protein [Candidatus Moranbacteria bacterium]